MVFVKVNGVEYYAGVSGQIVDSTWDGRESKAITINATYQEAVDLFPDGVEWSILVKTQGDGEEEESVLEYDNSEFNISGPVTDNRDGTITIKMGKPTDLEMAYEVLYA